MTSSRPFRAAMAMEAFASARSPRNPSARTFPDSSTATPRRSSDIIASGRMAFARSILDLASSSSERYISLNLSGSSWYAEALRRTSSLPPSSSRGSE